MIEAGRHIKVSIENACELPSYYYHLQPGGHVAALKAHLGNSWFLHADIRDFFGSINRTRVTRTLKPLFSYAVARRWAVDSSVHLPDNPSRNFLPYGFVQSPILASVCLRASALGKYLHQVQKMKGLAVTVYVDDIILSAPDRALVEKSCNEIQAAAYRSRFQLDLGPSSGPAPEISAFNIVLSEASMAIHPKRFSAFTHALAAGASEQQRQAIIGYVQSVCPSQVGDL